MSDAKVIVMIDIETLATSSFALALQGALVGLDLNTDEIFERNVHVMNYPGQPQIDMGSIIDFSTLVYWASMPEQFAKMLKLSDSTDTQELIAALRHMVAQFNYITDSGKLEHEVWTRGNFDLPILESLMKRLGISVPWHFRNVRDLRTLIAAAGLDIKTVPEPEGFVKHDAYWDCIFQIDCYRAANLKLRSRA